MEIENIVANTAYIQAGEYTTLCVLASMTQSSIDCMYTLDSDVLVIDRFIVVCLESCVEIPCIDLH